MKDTAKIIRTSRYVIISGCFCFLIFIGFLLMSYYSSVARLNTHFEENTFPKMTELINQRINLFFTPSVKGLSLLAENLDWQSIMKKASSDPKWLKARMKEWTVELEVNSVGLSDRYKKIAWDNWSNTPITLDPKLARDEWFFDLWKREKIPLWTFTLYLEDSAKDYQLYIDRLIHNINGQPIGSIAVQISLSELREQLISILSEGERVIILDNKKKIIIDISRMVTGKGVKTFSFENSSTEEKSNITGDPLLVRILSQDDDRGRIKADEENIFYNSTPLFNGEISILTIMDTKQILEKEKISLVKQLVILFTSFALFIGMMLTAMMLFSQKLKSLAIKLELKRSKFEDLLFIVTHGIGNEILQLQKSLTGLPQGIPAGVDSRLNEIYMMIQNSVNAARFDSVRDLIIPKQYNFLWQWEKLCENFELLSSGKGQTFTASPAVECMIYNDEEMVYQILANLVSNAIKYTPQGGKVKLNAMVEGSNLFITVSDSGPGFLQEEGLEMFSKFKRLSAKPSGGEHSTGLGLYIVKQLSDACNIRLALSRGEGEYHGAVWKLEFKLVQSAL